MQVSLPNKTLLFSLCVSAVGFVLGWVAFDQLQAVYGTRHVVYMVMLFVGSMLSILGGVLLAFFFVSTLSR